MKKILCLILCVLMCAMVLPVFASCGKKTQEIDLENCQIVRSDNLNNLCTRELSNFSKRISDNTGVTVKVYAEAKATEGATTYEILVGQTSRPETEKAMKSLKNSEGYTIQVIKNKVVIVGTNDALTYLGLQEFENTYFGEEKTSKVLSVETSKIKTDCTLMEIVKDGKIDYTVIYSQKWDTTNDGYQDNDLINNNKVSATLDIWDYQYRQIFDFMSDFSSVVGVKSMNSQHDQKSATQNEIIIGTTARTETATALSMINENQYIITTVNGKIVATGWNDQAVQLAADKLTEILTDCVAKSGSTVTVTYPADLTYIGKFSNSWVTDFPKPTGDGVFLYGTADVADNQVEYLYTGSGVTMAAFEAYAAQLQAEGYSVYSDNTVEGSRFATFNNSTTSLYVAYSAYAHKLESETYEPMLRVVSAKLSSVTLPQVTADLNYTKVFTDENVGADTGALVCQMYLSYEEAGIFGNSYVTMLEDGSFILYDGGGNGYSDTDGDGLVQGQPIVSQEEEVRLYALMRDLQNLVGIKGQKITISAWLMSHAHWDHMTCFKDLCKRYAASIAVEMAYCNFASTVELFNSYNPGTYFASNLATSLDYTSGNGSYVKIHTGQTFWVRNAEIEVLYTHEDKFPECIHYFNDTSTVFRIHYHVTDGKGNLDDGENGAVTGIWLGDLWKEGSALVSAMYGDYLKSDMAQVAHHGYNGCEKLIYSQIKPTLLWWPTCGISFIDQAYVSTSGTYQAIVDRYLANQLETVKWIMVAGAITSGDVNGYNKDFMYDNTSGDYNYVEYRHNYTLKVTKNGFDGDKLYFACETNNEGVGGDKFTGSCPAHGAGYYSE